MTMMRQASIPFSNAFNKKEIYPGTKDVNTQTLRVQHDIIGTKIKWNETIVHVYKNIRHCDIGLIANGFECSTELQKCSKVQKLMDINTTKNTTILYGTTTIMPEGACAHSHGQEISSQFQIQVVLSRILR